MVKIIAETREEFDAIDTRVKQLLESYSIKLNGDKGDLIAEKGNPQPSLKNVADYVVRIQPSHPMYGIEDVMAKDMPTLSPPGTFIGSGTNYILLVLEKTLFNLTYKHKTK